MVNEDNYSRHGFYADSLGLLTDAGVRFLVGGAFAFGVYTGIARDTKDFDLMVLPEDIESALNVFRKAGYRAELTFTHWLAKVHLGEAFIDLIFSSGNGLCVVDEQWFQYGREAVVFGKKVRICPPEEMIWQKSFIMERERFDGADVAHLIRACGVGLDWVRLVERFGRHWRVLLSHLILFAYIYPAERRLVPGAVIKQLLARLSEAPESPEVCNGTYLSRAQYLTDVERWGLKDPREADSAMSAEQIEAWTLAIDQQQANR